MDPDTKINDSDTQVSFFKTTVKRFVEKRGWKKYHTPKNLIQAMDIELAELSELFLFVDYDMKDILNNEELYKNIKEEVADIFIYLISFVNTLNIDLSESFVEKMEKNRKKYDIKEFNDGRYYKK
ncbi:MAG: nucleotide pyrophosphohydrolase [Candidatus Lokiarchaeota archaeon]|nr:nucleotide pyrophosphohydrolase [Candidatus Lokiarchaeota archaeon]